MTNREKEIHKGLNSIAPEIANFFKDAVTISELEIESKPYLLSHLAREIESGLRDILTPTKLKEDEKCEKCGATLNRKFGHKESILYALGIEEETTFARKWHKLAREFPKYAHRHGILNSPRNREAFNENWETFLDILEYLVGNYYSIADRLDVIIIKDTPTEQFVASLKNLLALHARRIYFFKNIKSSKWLGPLHEEGYFNPANNPKPLETPDLPGQVSIAFWPALLYLETVAKENWKAPEHATTSLLIKIVEDVFNHKENEKRLVNSFTDYSLFKIITAFPFGYLTSNHLNMAENLIQSNAAYLLGDDFNLLLNRNLTEGNRDLIKQSIDILFAFKVSDEAYDKVDSIFESHSLMANIEANKEKLIDEYREELFDCLLKKTKIILKTDITYFSQFNIPSIENHEQTPFPDRLDCQIIYLLRDCLDLSPPTFTGPKVMKLLTSKLEILQRVAVHAINKKFKELSGHFWKWGYNPIELSHIKHELYELLKSHCKDFDKQELKTIQDWIENASYFVSEESKKNKTISDKIIANEKRMWLDAFKGAGIECFELRITELLQIDSSEIEHPGFNTWHSGLIGNMSPLSIDEMGKLKKEELLDYFDTFKKQRHEFIGPSVEGFLDILTYVVKQSPSEYTTEIELLEVGDIRILYAWMTGLSRSWRDERKTFQCKEIFEVVINVVSAEYWKDYNEVNYKRYFISSLVSFIDGGLHDDDHAFPPDLLPKIKQIINIVYINTKKEVPATPSNLMIDVLNTSYGKIHSTLLQYSLRNARVESKIKQRWEEDIKILFDKVLNSKTDDPIVFFIMGEYLPQLEFLDHEWLLKNFNAIFPLQHNLNWVASMRGYFHSNKQVNVKFSRLMQENGHFEYTLEQEFLDIPDSTKKMIVQVICGLYVHGSLNTTINSKLFQMLLNTKKEKVYIDIVHFISFNAFERAEELLERIKALWRTIYERTFKLSEPNIDIIILSGCCRWLKHFKTMDASIEHLLKDSAPHILPRDRSFVLDLLQFHIEKTPQLVGEILIKIFEKEVPYDLSRSKVDSMVQKLYEKNIKTLADKICLLHSEKGLDYLRDTYKKFNQAT